MPGAACRSSGAMTMTSDRRGGSRRALRRSLGHASRSPSRNCSARSRRMWGKAGVLAVRRVRAAAGGSAGSGSRSRRPRIAVRPVKRARRTARRRIVRQVAGKDRDFGLAVEGLAADGLAGERRADDRRQASRVRARPSPRASRAPRRAPPRRPRRRQIRARSMRAFGQRARIASSRSWLA